MKRRGFFGNLAALAVAPVALAKATPLKEIEVTRPASAAPVEMDPDYFVTMAWPPIGQHIDW